MVGRGPTAGEDHATSDEVFVTRFDKTIKCHTRPERTIRDLTKPGET